MVRTAAIEDGVISADQAVQFLQRASFGPTFRDVEILQSIGIDAWLDEQFAIEPTASNFEQIRQGDLGWASIQWKDLLTGEDQLRRRVAYALSQILVVSTVGIPWPAVAVHADLLEQHAFGNYRELLEAVTVSYPMAKYLTYLFSRKADRSTGRTPDENYARELLQLFSIGLVELQNDGTPTIADGTTIPTYDQEDVTSLARVFTGYIPDWDATDPELQFVRRLRQVEGNHSPEAKSFLGITIPAGTGIDDSRRIALDTIANHPNVGPFIGRQLIQRLVSSNPSPAYVARIAAVWADDGNGERGNLEAVIRAILTDSESVDPVDVGAGKLREPVLRFSNVARLLGTYSPDGTWAIPSTSNAATKLGQMPMSAPSVFNFYRPGYVPPQTELSAAGLRSPEFQLATETSVIGWINFIATWVRWPNKTLDFDERPALLDLTEEPEAFVDLLGTMLCAGRLTDETAAIVLSALTDIAFNQDDTRRRERFGAGITLLVASTDYLYER